WIRSWLIQIRQIVSCTYGLGVSVSGVEPSIGKAFIFSMNFLSTEKTHKRRQMKNIKNMTKEIIGHTAIFSIL
ncbi:MAG TPA: hypothetical protein VK666_10605, partial [Chryseolinea sp.]|nr:hypothetical protein [Chryseolinea sp.]